MQKVNYVCGDVIQQADSSSCGINVIAYAANIAYCKDPRNS